MARNLPGITDNRLLLKTKLLLKKQTFVHILICKKTAQFLDANVVVYVGLHAFVKRVQTQRTKMIIEDEMYIFDTV